MHWVTQKKTLHFTEIIQSEGTGFALCTQKCNKFRGKNEKPHWSQCNPRRLVDRRQDRRERQRNTEFAMISNSEVFSQNVMKTEKNVFFFSKIQALINGSKIVWRFQPLAKRARARLTGSVRALRFLSLDSSVRGAWWFAREPWNFTRQVVVAETLKARLSGVGGGKYEVGRVGIARDARSPCTYKNMNTHIQV